MSNAGGAEDDSAIMLIVELPCPPHERWGKPMLHGHQKREEYRQNLVYRIGFSGVEGEKLSCLLEQGAKARERLSDDSFCRPHERHDGIVSLGPEPRQIDRCEVQHNAEPEQQEAAHEILGEQPLGDDPAKDARRHENLHHANELAEGELHRQAQRPTEIDLLRRLRQRHEQAVSHTVDTPADPKTNDAMKNDEDQRMLSDNCGRSHHEQHRRKIDSTSHNRLVRELPNEVTTDLCEDVSLRRLVVFHTRESRIGYL